MEFTWITNLEKMANGEIPESLEYKQQMDKIVDDVLAKIKRKMRLIMSKATDNQDKSGITTKTINRCNAPTSQRTEKSRKL